MSRIEFFSVHELNDVMQEDFPYFKLVFIAAARGYRKSSNPT